MFRGPEYDVYDIIGQLSIKKRVYDSTGFDMGGDLDGECMYEDALNAIGIVADKIEYAYLEDYDNTLHKFYFDQMYEFFELCRKLARQKGIAFRNEPHVIDAIECIESELGDIPDYSIGWNIFVPKKLNGNKTYSVLIELGCEFTSFIELVEALYNIRDYFISQEKMLRKELEKPKIVPLPKSKSKRKPKSNPTRRAA